jgi:tripartite-type tricarboxylate transporter receptor subunit TctC
MLTEQPIKRYADVPTLRQLGINPWMSSPYGLAAPAGTDPAVIKVLHDAFRKGLESPNSVRAMEQLNQVPYYRGPDDYRAFITDMFAKEKVRLDRMRQRGVLN